MNSKRDGRRSISGIRRRCSGRHIETPRQLRQAIARLSPSSPITDKFTSQWLKLGSKCGQPLRKVPWWKTEHEHWLGWLKEWDGPGYYGRKNWKRSAEFIYNHIIHPPLLVFLAEGAKVDQKLIRMATKSALANASSMASMSSAIRHIIPWPVVEVQLLRATRTSCASMVDE